MQDNLLPENVYGHTKKIQYFRSSIDNYRKKNGPNLRILDIGCGSGFAVTRFLSNKYDNILGIDMYLPNIEYAKSHFENSSTKFALMKAEELIDSNEVFDIVIMADVLEHLDEPKKILQTVSSLLRKNGLLLITIPNGHGCFELESSLSRAPIIGRLFLRIISIFVGVLNRTILKNKWTQVNSIYPVDLPYNSDSGHVQFFSRNDLQELLNSVGLKIDSQRSLSFLSGPFTNTLFSASKIFCSWNIKIVDYLPASFASAWFFECSQDN